VVLSGYSVWFPPPIKLTIIDITEILLKVVLNTITPTLSLFFMATGYVVF
jgi:hypothetical protein